MTERKAVLVQGSQFFDSDGSAASGLLRESLSLSLSLTRARARTHAPIVIPSVPLMWTTGRTIRHIITALLIWVAIFDVTCDVDRL